MSRSDAPERLRRAIEAGDLAGVTGLIASDRSLLQAIVVPGNANRNYRPLTHAAVQNQLEILRYLIAQGGSVSEDHNFPMFRAALYDSCVPALATLVAYGADVNGVWADYGPPLIASCESGSALACTRWLLDHGARIAGRGQGVTRIVEWDAVVHAAHIHQQHPEVLRLLLDRGGSVNGREHGTTALHVVAKRGDVAGVKRLLDSGADPAGRDEKGRLPGEVTRNSRVRELLAVAAEDDPGGD